VVVQKNHVLLRFLKLRLVVNGMHIYNLRNNKPVLVTMPTNPAQVVVTDGFHITQTMELKCRRPTTYLNVACAIDNDVLIGGFVFMLMFFAMGSTSGVFVLQLFSMLPLIYILFIFYIRRREFIQLREATA
jgi:hypothetical protein